LLRGRGLSESQRVELVRCRPDSIFDRAELAFTDHVHDLDADHQLRLDLRRYCDRTFKRTDQRGSGGSSAVALEYDFRVNQRWPVALTAIQGLSGGKRNTVLEVDMTF